MSNFNSLETLGLCAHAGLFGCFHNPPKLNVDYTRARSSPSLIVRHGFSGRKATSVEQASELSCQCESQCESRAVSAKVSVKVEVVVLGSLSLILCNSPDGLRGRKAALK